MSKAQRIVDQILGDERYKNSRTFASRVYEDEPILRTGASAYGRFVEKPRMPRREPLPARYGEVRRLARDRKVRGWSYAYTLDSAKLFVEQARLLADYEDDYDDAPDEYVMRGGTPTYEDLSNHDLRCYVSWRTKLRRGDVTDAPTAFWRILTYELICGIGVEPGVAGYEALQRIAADDVHAAAVHDQVVRWAHDYAIYHGLPTELIRENAASSAVRAVGVLRRAEDALLTGRGPVVWPSHAAEDMPTPQELLDALVALSRYRADRSRFFKAHAEDVEWVACRVFADMVAHCSKRRKTGFVDGLFGSPARVSYAMFPAALFWSETLHPDATYVVSSVESYVCERGFWWRTMPCRRAERNRELGAILHAIDARMRRAMGDKHELKDKPLPKYQEKFVDARIAELVEQRAAEEAARITIDRSALRSIRSAAARTREALLTDEERVSDVEQLDLETVAKSAPLTIPATEVANAPAGQAKADPSPTETGVQLEERQRELLLALLDGRPLEGFDSLAISLCVDAINEVFLDIVGDTILEFDGDAPVLVEDYVDEVRAAVP
ncbi:MAG: TerB N-terminal domain-containing protein [Atopobiaceae bacterium]|nr:TerB N-terminal domain-containing protein [Atopobiaceae bacterium]